MDFLAQITAQLQANSARQELNDLCKDRTVNVKPKIVGNELDSLNNKQIFIDARISDSSLQNMRNQIESMARNINIDLNSMFNRNGNNLRRTGQRIGNVISDEVQHAIGQITNNGILDNGFIVSKHSSNRFKAEMDRLVSDWTKGKGSVVDFKINTRTIYDNKADENVERMHSALVTYNNELGETIKKTITWQQIGTRKNGDGSSEKVFGWVESSTQYSKSLQEISKQTDNFANKQTKTITKLSNQVRDVYRDAIDPNASKPIKQQSHLNEIERRYNEINTEIGRLQGLSGTAFVQQENHVISLIESLKIYKREMKNAETTATSLRAKPIETVKDETRAKIKGLEADIKKAGVSSSELTDYLSEMNNVLNGTNVDATSINNVLNTYALARAELTKLKKEATANESLEKAKIKSSSLTSEIEKAKVDNPNLVNFKAQINGTEVSVDDLINSLSQVKTAGDVSVITEQWKAFCNQAKQASVMAQTVSDDTAKLSKIDTDFNTGKYEFNLVKMQSDLSDIQTTMNEINSNKSDDEIINIDSINKAKTALDNFKDAYKALQKHFSGEEVLSNDKLLNSVKQMQDSMSLFNNSMNMAKIDVKPFLQMQKAYDEISNFEYFSSKAISNQNKDKYGNTKQYQQMVKYIDIAKKAKQELDFELSKGKDANFDRLNASLKQMNSATSKAKSQFDKLEQPISDIDKSTAFNNTLAWLKENTKASKKYGDALQEIARLQKEASDWGELDNLNKRFKNITSEAKQLGLTGKTFFGEIKESFIHIAEFTQIYGLIQNVIQELPMEMARAVIEVDDAMTNLRMATSVTNEEAKNLMKTYSELGKELKTLGTDVATSATEWLKQGKSITEASALAKDSIILSKIGDMSSEDATKTITAVMKSYDLAESEVMDFIDQISAIDMASATDVAGLSDAFNEVAANARQAGVETEKLLSYAAVIGETTQEGMAGVGTALNAIFSRMGNIKLSRLKDFETGEDLSNVETVLRKVGIYLRDSEGQFREFDEVLDETASRFNSFSSVTQRAVANAFAGTHHANDFIVLMQNYSQAQEYMDIALSSSGESLKKFEAYTDSASGKIEGFKNAFQSLSVSILDSDLFKGVIDSGTKLLTVLENIIDLVGVLPILLGSFNIGKLIATKSLTKSIGNSYGICPLWV